MTEVYLNSMYCLCVISVVGGGGWATKCGENCTSLASLFGQSACYVTSAVVDS